MDMFKTCRQNKLLAILRNVPDEILLDYVGAIREGGVRFFELAMNTPNACGQIDRIQKAYDDVLIGAGTAITVDRAKAAFDAGAQFLLTPSISIPVLEWCVQTGTSLLPGVFTATDVTTCMAYGYTTLKLFPAGDMPMHYIKSLRGPLDGTNYVAIGGVTRENAHAFLGAGYIGVGLGSNLLPNDKVAARDWKACSQAVHTLRDSLQ